MNINRGDIWYIGNGYPAVGSEQRPGRPAVVVSNQRNNQYGEVVEVVYLTTAPKRDLPTHVTIRSSGRVSTAPLRADFYGIGGAARQLLRPCVGQRADRD